MSSSLPCACFRAWRSAARCRSPSATSTRSRRPRRAGAFSVRSVPDDERLRPRRAGGRMARSRRLAGRSCSRSARVPLLVLPFTLHAARIAALARRSRTRDQAASSLERLGAGALPAANERAHSRRRRTGAVPAAVRARRAEHVHRDGACSGS